MKSKILAFISIVAMSGSVYAEAYLCITDKATGFSFQDGEWASTDFNVDGEKFILRKRTKEEVEAYSETMGTVVEMLEEIEGDSEVFGQGYDASVDDLLKSTHVVFRHGADDFPLYFCRYVPITGSFLCFGINKGEYLFSTKSGRFMMTYPVGYWRGKDNDQTPTMSIGRCSKI